MVLGNKKAALEMSMTTIITIVLSVVFLILALTVLRTMYGFQTESIGSIQEKTLKQINQLYLSGEESTTHIFIGLGSEKTANIRAGTSNFGIEVGAGTLVNSRVENSSQMQFNFRLDRDSPNNCVKLLGATQVISWFQTRLDTWLDVEKFSDSAGGMAIILNIPSGTRTCTQKVYVTARDRTVDSSVTSANLGQDFFIINIMRKSVFG